MSSSAPPPPPFSFVPSYPFREAGARGLWFAFARGKLLLSETFAVPNVRSLEELELTPLRTQLLGYLDGEPCYGAELASNAVPPLGTQLCDLRMLYGRLREALMGVAVRAVQLVEWNRAHQYCGACAAETVPHPSARSRVCSDPSCAQEHFPRLSPAIIVAVERGPEILLARGAHFPPGIYSVLAGFVDPGESVEDAVHREVLEETGIRIQNVRYFGSQPWPFPNSLMLGFQADYAGGDITLGDDELEDAGFYHAEALPKTFPGSVSISQWLLHDFLRRQGCG